MVAKVMSVSFSAPGELSNKSDVDDCGCFQNTPEKVPESIFGGGHKLPRKPERKLL